MRHGDVAYFRPDGAPVAPDTVELTEEGVRQAEAAHELLAGIPLDVVLASTLPRTLQTARIVAPRSKIAQWSELGEIRGSHLSSIPVD